MPVTMQGCGASNYYTDRVMCSSVFSCQPSTGRVFTVSSHASDSSVRSYPLYFTLPASGWFSGKAMIMENGFKVARAFICDYFVERHTNNCPTNNFHALKTDYNLFASGHVQACQLSLYRSESQDITTDLKFSLLCRKYSLQWNLIWTPSGQAVLSFVERLPSSLVPRLSMGGWLPSFRGDFL